ncbi:hypothetical protein [Nocardia thraciensis]
MTNQSTPTQAAWPGDTECPVRAGDEVAPRHAPDAPGRVLRVYTDNAITVCTVQTHCGATYFTHPWALATADAAIDPVDWDLRMQHFLTVQRDRVVYRMRELQRDVLHRVVALTERATTITTELCAGRTRALPIIHRWSSPPPTSMRKCGG